MPEADAVAALDEMLAEASKPMRILTIDIETMAPLVYTWTLRKANIGLNQIAKPGRVICFAAKWRHEGRVRFWSEHEHGHDAMIAAAYELMNEADAIVHYNGTRFDVKHLYREFEQDGWPRPAPHKDIDLMTAWSRNFVTSSGSRKLDAVLMELGMERKLDAGGFELWWDCDRGDEKAWRLMRRYNIQDVKATEALYERLLPWIDSHPHHGLYGHNPDEAGQMQCQRCGSTALQRRGYATTRVGKYPRYICKKCRSWSRGKSAVATVGARGAM